jgi:hypothetical protein
VAKLPKLRESDSRQQSKTLDISSRNRISDPSEEAKSRIVTTLVTEPPSVVDSVLPETALSRTSPNSMSTHPL